MQEEKSMQSLGGDARAKSLTEDQRKEIAQKAAAARWKLPRAVCGSDENPLKIGEFEIPCYVLDNGKRVLVKAGMVSALGMKEGSASRSIVEGDRLVKFISGKRISPYVSNDLADMIKSPLRFVLPSGGIAYGYEATILADICAAVIEAADEDKLQRQQLHIAKKCKILSRGFIKVGIIALVDEATGWQKLRAKRALHEILEQFIAKDLRAWVMTFQDDFYEELFRLRDWDYISSIKNNKRRPVLVGKITNNIVYDRLAPFVKDHLKKITPRDSKGRLKHKYHQRLTENIGYRKLLEHLAAVTALMKASDNWIQFKRSLDRALPRYTDQTDLFQKGEAQS